MDYQEAAKACSLSSQTRTTFIEANGETVDYPTECGNLKPTVRLADEAMVLFLREWVPTLATCDAVLRYGRARSQNTSPYSPYSPSPLHCRVADVTHSDRTK